MTENTKNLLSKLEEKHNGAFFKVVIRSKLPTTSKAPDVIEKVVIMTVRKGIDYKAQKSVQEKVEEGKELTHKLPWGNWIKGFEGLLIEHKGAEYVRLYSTPNKVVTTYLCNGREVPKKEIEWEVRDSYWRHDGKPDAMTVRTENVRVL